MVGTTCLGAGHPLFSQRTFDVCIVDESTQVLQISVVRSLFSAKKFVLVGDPEQLPPVIRSKRARCVFITHGALMVHVLLASLAAWSFKFFLLLHYRIISLFQPVRGTCYLHVL